MWFCTSAIGNYWGHDWIVFFLIKCFAPIFKIKYSWPMNNMSLKGAGLLIHKFFSVNTIGPLYLSVGFVVMDLTDPRWKAVFPHFQLWISHLQIKILFTVRPGLNPLMWRAHCRVESYTRICGVGMAHAPNPRVVQGSVVFLELLVLR